ncbi:unnamed protein product [Mycetohabitans rhizoxinica HKI 454]|uniref:Uncharacterized protein n=1 Tax=Mycetohabitans rhizoxinica (strain DSM 19002 / CIP 109453 / HKI 454) TaxID=882378 RepID=E5AMG3_MYCRK|nr:unnamed protein product [Mycetohabitans rhizoxinica HKI 454]
MPTCIRTPSRCTSEKPMRWVSRTRPSARWCALAITQTYKRKVRASSRAKGAGAVVNRGSGLGRGVSSRQRQSVSSGCPRRLCRLISPALASPPSCQRWPIIRLPALAYCQTTELACR